MYEGFIEGPFDKYLCKMAAPGCYGDARTLAAAAAVRNVRIVVVAVIGNKVNLYRTEPNVIPGAPPRGPGPAVVLQLDQDVKHYNVITSEGGRLEGVYDSLLRYFIVG